MTKMKRMRGKHPPRLGILRPHLGEMPLQSESKPRNFASSTKNSSNAGRDSK